MWSEEGVDLTLEQLLLNAADYSQQWHAPVDPDELQDPVFQVDIKARALQLHYLLVILILSTRIT